MRVFFRHKQQCEEIANMLSSLDLNTAKQRSSVQGFTLQAVARLSPNDAVLPQVLTICEMVKRGIGVVSCFQISNTSYICGETLFVIWKYCG
jgi:superfamily II RNA helicase